VLCGIEDSVGVVEISLLTGLELPAVRGRRERVVSREQPALILAAVPVEDQALWGHSALRRPPSRRTRGADLGERQHRDDRRRVLLGRSGGAGRAEVTGRCEEGPDPGHAAEVPARAPALDRPLDRTRVRTLRDDPVRSRRDSAPCRQGVHEAWPRAGHAARLPTRFCLVDDRCRGQRESALDVHGAREHHDHPRSLRAPDAGQRGGGRRAPRRIPRWRINWRKIAAR
jgi:hypothetical protein